jgi:ferredoxin/flavodoxin
MSNIIFYFSGTGNSLAVASAVAEKLTDTEVVSIIALRENKIIPEHYAKIGFVYPTCYSHASKIVLDLVKGLQLHSNQKIFLIATCGGGQGFALSDMKQQLQSSTRNVIQEFSVALPGNHIVGFSAWPNFIQNILFNRAKKTIDKIVYQIQNDIPTKPIRTPPFPKYFTLMQKTLNEKVLGVPDIYETQPEFYTTDACEHCGICEKLCLANNIKVSSNNVQFGDRCEQCMACIQWCPNRAISHSNVPKSRKRYHHPDVTLDDMLQAEKTVKDI